MYVHAVHTSCRKDSAIYSLSHPHHFPLYHLGKVRLYYTKDLHIHRLGMQILSVHPIPLYHMGWVGLYQGFIHTQTGHANTIGPPYPTVPHGIGGTVPGIHTYTDWACKSYLSVLSLYTTWDVWDCTRASYIQTLGMQILSVCPIPLYHMGWVGLYQGFMRTQTGHANPICPSYPTVPHGMDGTVPGIHTYTH